MTIIALAVVGRENNPVYLRAFDSSDSSPDVLHPSSRDALRCNLLVHASLDVVEERMEAQKNTARTPSSSKADSYLGMVYPCDDLCVYAYVTNSRVKLFTVVDDEGEVRDAEMRALFRRLHTLYIDTICNPFHKPESELRECASFQRQVERIVEAGLY